MRELDLIKQEVIEELMSKSREVTFGDDDNVYLSRKRTIELISQIDGLAKVIVPKFVAEWIEEKKKSGIDLHMSMAYEVKADVFRYILDNSETYARAWLDGYEVEQEKLYTVEIPNPNSAGGKLVLFKQQNTGRLILDILNPNTNKPKYLHITKYEIKKDFEWAWDAGFAKEVE